MHEPYYPDELRPLMEHRLLPRDEEVIMTRAIAEGNRIQGFLETNPDLEEEVRAFLEEKNADAEDFRKQLPFFYVRSMVKICDKFRDRVRKYCDYMDLINEAFLVTQDFILRIGLEGSSNFDPERGVRFLTFLWRKLFFEIRSYSRKSGNTELVHIPSKVKQKRGYDNVIFASGIIADGDGNEGDLEVFTSGDTPVLDLICDFEELDDIRDAIEKCGLNAREMEVLQRNQGLNRKPKEALNNIKDDFGVTKERVRQIKNKAKSKLAEYLIKTHPRFKALAELQLAKDADSDEN